MAIKALFLSGRNDATTENLYQWDYGQELEIEFPDLGSMLCEVHFACHGMSEAIVRPCTLSAGIGDVTIPDDCLEQSSAITAWIYEKGANESRGRTRGVITIPVVARTRPGVVRDIPPETNDQYTLLIEEVNDAIDKIENGEVKAKYAGEADTAKNAGHATTADIANTAGNANHANTAGSASSATNATSAGFATNAGTATKALKDADGIDLKDVLHCPADGYALYDNGSESEETSIKGGLVAFKITRDNESDIRLITEVGGTQATNYSATFYDEVAGGKNPGIYPMRLVFTHKSMGNYNVKVQALVNGTWYDQSYAGYPVGIYYKHLIDYHYAG